MSDNVMIAMILISTLLGATGLVALLWGVKTGQFDDKSKFIDAARFDSEDDLRDAVEMEKRRKAFEKKHRSDKNDYRPAD